MTMSRRYSWFRSRVCNSIWPRSAKMMYRLPAFRALPRVWINL
jgi:hypothetical protein